MLTTYKKLVKEEGARTTFHFICVSESGVVVREWELIQTLVRCWESTPIDGLGYLGKKINELDGFIKV